MKTGHVYITWKKIRGRQVEGWEIALRDNETKAVITFFANGLPVQNYPTIPSYDSAVIKAAIQWVKENTKEEPPEENCWAADYPGKGGVY